VRGAAPGTVHVQARHSPHGHIRCLCQLEHFAEPLVPRTFSDGDVFDRTTARTQGLKHWIYSVNSIVGHRPHRRRIMRLSGFTASLMVSRPMIPGLFSRAHQGWTKEFLFR
jgi:hypothetical protein